MSFLINVSLQDKKINTDQEIQHLKSPYKGAIVTFHGTVREWTDEVKTISITYTAYEKMAIREMINVSKEVWTEDTAITVIHRIGTLDPMDTAVFIGVAAPHRQEAFQICTHIIEELKVRVPIWKEECNATKS
ncbi:molybdenum cofactor biosynthesis protein MoaE [Candidatus Enterococcus testudinis]|uniref:molybdenum cofactor biosynthesis protein MoaE n=1 Tax=Candidatus Enterococcus testudinis TaxID=1834191 RepID=UPI00211A90A6|nr:molybdenum cofactor biosynthesis protein MoaE [Enterococcus sp. 8G7_MSG3316]